MSDAERAGGAWAVSGTETVEVPAEPAEVVDTTGAGDAYAALAGLTAGRPLAECGRLGSVAAAKISHDGARPQRVPAEEMTAPKA